MNKSEFFKYTDNIVESEVHSRAYMLATGLSSAKSLCSLMKNTDDDNEFYKAFHVLCEVIKMLNDDGLVHKSPNRDD